MWAIDIAPPARICYEEEQQQGIFDNSFFKHGKR